MYLGAFAALAGAPLFYQSGSLLAYLALFALTMHAFVIWYEEPTLTRTFAADYAEYRCCVRRWLPAWRGEMR
jgi:protein-S-isoprenylcysteine O-methyltransferase Ste14